QRSRLRRRVRLTCTLVDGGAESAASRSAIAAQDTATTTTRSDRSSNNERPSLPRPPSRPPHQLQLHPGKNFGSMNMDEFLKNIWTAEESQAMAAAMGSIGEGTSSGGPTHGNSLGMLSRQPSLQRQGSITLPRTLSRKTVDEVWKDIHRNITGTSDSGPPAGSGPQERQQTFGEMTLEDFLMKAGVVREDMEIGSQGFGPFVGGSNGGQNGLSLSPMQYGMEGPLRGRKRGADGPVEKVVERRQKRMIKNRESAARSRARKQAYTVELEAEVSQLKEENMKLRKQQAHMIFLQMIEVLKTMSKNPVVSEGKILRRTRTATW
ncbi:unnamed protein product, partial [Sphagnum jensenii]